MIQTCIWMERWEIWREKAMAAAQGSPLWTSGKWQVPVWCSPASNVSVQSARRKATCSMSFCTVTGTGTGTESDTGRRKGLEGVLVSCMGQCISHVNEHLIHLCLVSLSFLSFPFNGLKKKWFCAKGQLDIAYYTVSYWWKLLSFPSLLLRYSSFSFNLFLPASPSRMLLKCWRRAMNSTRSRVRAWPSGELHLSWRVCPGRWGAWTPFTTCPAWGSTLRRS